MYASVKGLDKSTKKVMLLYEFELSVIKKLCSRIVHSSRFQVIIECILATCLIIFTKSILKATFPKHPDGQEIGQDWLPQGKLN